MPPAQPLILHTNYQHPTTPSCTDLLAENNITVAMLSGKSVTQMGLFEQCINETGFKYGFLNFINKTTSLNVGIEMGLCVPTICKSAQIEELANELFEEMKQNVTGHFIENPQEFYPGFGFAFYFCAVLLSLFSLLVIVATFIPKVSKMSHVVGSFSLRHNMHIFEYKQHKFNVFNGIKAFCMLWVILGHLFSVRIQNVLNVLTITDQIEVPFFLVILAAFYAVDVFFYIGGFLVAYSFLRNKMKSIMKYPLAILHRVLRFWPSYIMAMLIYYSMMLHTGEGPVWFKLLVVGQIENCRAMWKPIFFVDNIVQNGQNMCMAWGWYLQNDMQIFIVSIPILYLYNQRKRFAYILIWVIVGLSLIYNFVEVQRNSYVTVAHRADFAKWATYFLDVYTKPWTRCPPYLYGLTLGLLYMEWIEEEKNKKENKGFFGKVKERMQNSRALKNISQLVGIGIILFIVFIPRTLQVGHKWPQVMHSFYLTFTKLLFVVGVSLMVTPSLLGLKNDLVFWLMDTKLFNFIAKISFWTYLIHYMIIEYICYTQKVDFYYDVGDILTIYIPVCIFSMFFGFIGTLLIQTPFAKLEKMLFQGKKQKKKQAKSSKQDLTDHVKQHYKGQDLLSQSVGSGSSLVSSGDLKSSSLKSSLLDKSQVE